VSKPRQPLSIWIYVAAAVAMVVGYLLFSLQRVGGDGRPVGSVADISALSERKDLNVLFILIDTLRANRLGAYGYQRDTSPNLDYLARTGVRFAHNLSQSSWTKASMASLWTGLYPQRTRVLRYSDAMAQEARMPAEILRDAGFRTMAIWRNGWVAPNFGFDQGFDTYHNPKPTPVPKDVRRENPSFVVAGTDYDVIDSALDFFRSFADQRWFLYLHLMDVHQYVYDPESALFGTSYSDIYDNAIHHTDAQVGMLIAGLRDLGLSDRTLVVLAADHGEAFGEHDVEGHARNLYGEVTETPLLLSFPFRLEPGVVVDAATQNVDLWPTLLDLLGLPALPDPDGHSRLEDIVRAGRGMPASDGSAPRFAELDRTWGRTTEAPLPLVAVTQDGYRLIYYVDDGKVELYDLAQDPGEKSDLAASRPEIVERLRGSIDTYLAHDAPPWGSGAPQVELEEMLLRQLRALGYKVD